MYITLMKSKIHNCVVTDAQLHYVGSVTIDQDLMDACGMFPGEKVLIVNNQNGNRIETYTIKGKRGSGVICLNGAAAHKFSKGDTVIIMSFAQIKSKHASVFKGKVVFPHSDNKAFDTVYQLTTKLIKEDIASKNKHIQNRSGELFFDKEYIDEMALRMALTESEIFSIIKDLKK